MGGARLSGQGVGSGEQEVAEDKARGQGNHVATNYIEFVVS